MKKTKKIISFLSLLASCFFMHVSPLFAHSVQPVKKPYISYTESGQGEALLLIHAFPTDQQLWAAQQEELKKYFHVITLDLWGFGRSEVSDGKAVTMMDYAKEVKQLLDQLHIKKAIVGGESMGGYVALAFLRKYPDRLNGLILSDTQAIADSAETKIKREATAVDVLANGTEQFINGFMPKALSSMASEQKKLFLRNILAMQTTTGIASALRGMALRDDTSDVLTHTTLPILIITGDQDTLILPQQSQNMHVLAASSRLVTVSHAGHLSSLEQPEQWDRAVIDMFYKERV